MIFKAVDNEIRVMQGFLFRDNGNFLSDPFLDCIDLLLFLPQSTHTQWANNSALLFGIANQDQIVLIANRNQFFQNLQIFLLWNLEFDILIMACVLWESQSQMLINSYQADKYQQQSFRGLVFSCQLHQTSDYNKNMQDSRLSHYNKTLRIQSLVREAKRNGFLEQIQQVSKCTSGFDTSYRKKVTAYYKKKINKPFCLIHQPEYLRQLRFNSDFNAFVKSIPQFQKINQQPKIGASPQKQLYTDTLTFDFGKTCEVSPENVHKRKMQTIGVQSNTINQFGSKINLTEAVIKKKKGHENNQSRIDIILGDELNTEPLSPYSPKKKEANRKDLTLRITKLAKSRRQNISVSNNLTKQTATNINKVNINSVMALDNLNKLNNSQHKLRNFRISKQKLHEILCKKYGNQIITNFFGLQTIQDYKGVIKMVTQILTASPKKAQLITFLTYDYNQDGVITEDELTQLNSLIPSSSGINDDIHKMLAYAQSNLSKGDADLPPDFIKQPTQRQYMKINEQGKQVQIGSVRGIYRLFSFRVDTQHQTQNNLPTIAQKKVDLSKKNIRINFEQFQKIFEKVGHPNFIQDLVIFLLGKNYNKSQEISPRKVSFSHQKRMRKGTFSLEVRQKLTSYQSQQSSQVSRAQYILDQMNKDKGKMETLQYN